MQAPKREENRIVYLSWACRLLRGRGTGFCTCPGHAGSLEVGEQDCVLVLGMQTPKNKENRIVYFTWACRLLRGITWRQSTGSDYYNCQGLCTLYLLYRYINGTEERLGQ